MISAQRSSNSIRQVFVSYTKAGEDAALDLKKNIEAKFPRVRVWEWQNEISFGAEIEKQYLNGLKTSHVFVPVLTKNYKDRPGTRHEFDEAQQREKFLRSVYGEDYIFILPYLTEDDISILNLFDNPEVTDPSLKLSMRRVSKKPEEVIKTVNEDLEKLSLDDNPFSFINWPQPFIDERGKVDALVVIGHSGKEDMPTQDELGEIKNYIRVEGSESQPQSMRPAEYFPELLHFFNKQSLQSQIKLGKSIQEFELVSPGSLDIHVDWHLLKHYQPLIREKHLICLGAGDTNLISRWVMKYYERYLPVHFDAESLGSHTLTVTENGKFERISYKQVVAGQQLFTAVLLLLPNPFNNEKVVLIAAGLTGLGTQASMLALSDEKQLINQPTDYSNYVRVIKGIENNKWRASGYEIIR
jgi:TIR domain